MKFRTALYIAESYPARSKVESIKESVHNKYFKYGKLFGQESVNGSCSLDLYKISINTFINKIISNE